MIFPRDTRPGSNDETSQVWKKDRKKKNKPCPRNRGQHDRAHQCRKRIRKNSSLVSQLFVQFFSWIDLRDKRKLEKTDCHPHQSDPNNNWQSRRRKNPERHRWHQLKSNERLSHNSGQQHKPDKKRVGIFRQPHIRQDTHGVVISLWRPCRGSSILGQEFFPKMPEMSHVPNRKRLRDIRHRRNIHLKIFERQQK
ncbi:MAG: hypothetical protein BWY44_00250 [Candidatus Omnitrophica bacterium ADurb.Bin292]|nr:MAG: hypothetical protein BWY44_00250 [Candidatus Omnitrophica bacterium ADurb.Bin292]